MGITGLLPLLRSITRKVHLEQLAGQSVAVDAYSWLHRGIYGSCALDHFHGRPNDSFVEFCMAKVRLLQSHGVKPILVFDGAHLPMKQHQERRRAALRRDSRAKASELIAAGRKEAAHVLIQKSVDVTPRMAARLIAELRRAGVEYVVAPYEADAQMAYLDRVGRVSAVITEDSDLLLFGCKRVLFKLDQTGLADEICIDRLREATELDLSTFSHQKFRQLCMLSGCDYLPSIHGMGLKTAYKYVLRYPHINRVLQALRADMPTKMPAEYEAEFAKAEMTFLHQRVYDSERRRMCFLNPLPVTADFAGEGEGEGEEEGRWNFLGPTLADNLVVEVCEGRICPNTLKPFVADPIIGQMKRFAVVPPAAAVRTAAPEEENYPLTPPSSLPFEVHLDKKPAASENVIRSKHFAGPAFTSKAVAAARVTLKRPYSVDANGWNENVAPAAKTVRADLGGAANMARAGLGGATNMARADLGGATKAPYTFSATERVLAGLLPIHRSNAPNEETRKPVVTKTIREFFKKVDTNIVKPAE